MIQKGEGNRLKFSMKKIFTLCAVLLALASSGCAVNEEANSHELAEKFVSELYTVNKKEIESYNNLLKANAEDALKEAIEDIYKDIRILMSDEAYEKFTANRTGVRFAEFCSENNCYIEIKETILSERSTNENNNEKGYNFEVKLNIVSSKDGAEEEDVAEGIIQLTKENEEWKVSGYRDIKLPEAITKE
ncbi:MULTISPECIES: hypothetical protein [unclassified Sedimentibacter]|uniref:hypothetical protein n=1 Tax=unclassified Sedimentibacter TaxID=2649220 RepID=UPI0027E01025|nr:hypothetical protein [Sedimentibacter sp. MB35-C1]WMJ76016.1 hypothetical protein RBQ61_10270 [Sedimentibacter sp. MB35-C1]